MLLSMTSTRKSGFWATLSTCHRHEYTSLSRNG